MPESLAPPDRDIQNTHIQGSLAWTGQRQVRIHYGAVSVTVAVLEVTHTAKSHRGRSELVSIRHFPRDVFIADAEAILGEFVTELLTPLWRLA